MPLPTFSTWCGAPERKKFETHSQRQNWNMKIKTSLIAALGLGLAACDDTTDTIGIYTSSDNISASAAVFDAYTRSIVADSVLSNSNESYLGLITDPETGLDIKAEFLAQFATLEDYEFPAYDRMVKNSLGEIEADSIEIRLYYSGTYGLENNPMKVEVLELDTTNVIREDSTYYSNADLTKYINKKRSAPLARKVFTTKDFTQSDETLESDSYLPHVRIILPKEYGTFILRKYYENPDFFRTSYNFIHHVCPGFYFKLSNGNGTLFSTRVGAMNVFFKYKETGDETEYAGMARFSATPEVLQNTYIENGDLKAWVAGRTDCTYLKTPAGIFTEMTIPVDKIYEGHANDSISQAQLSFQRYNSGNDATGTQLMSIPQNLLMVRKDDMYSFFENQQVADSKTSYVATFDASGNTYTFTNIGNLIAYCRKYRNEQVAASGMTVEAWEAKNKDWNKVVLIPVEVNTDDDDNIISVTNDMSMGSARLVGGDNNPIQIQIIYSSFR